MRIRFWLYLTFGLFSIIPLLVMGYWAHVNLTQSELSRSGKSQLSLAETHADSISRYLEEQRRAFEMHLVEIEKTNSPNSSIHAETNDDIGRILVADIQTGIIESNFVLARQTKNSRSAPKRLGHELQAQLMENGSENQISISPLIRHVNGNNCVYFVTIKDGKIYAGELKTRFFTQLASGTRIGISGHAAIFDNKGSLIAHPNATWQRTAKTVKELKPVKMAIDGNSGVVEFYSPALEADMLAGVASIQTVNWGIMIPRTISDITSKTGFAKKSASIIFVLIMAAILLGAIIVSNFISKPMERLTKTLNLISENGNLGDFSISKSSIMPTESLELEKSFSHMSENLRQTHNKMKVLAYSDTVTSLPNREAFADIVEQSLNYMANKHLNGAMLFIDVENFKEVNDSYGHDVGDQVLRCLGARFGSILELATGSTPTKILETHFDENGAPRACVARFGGDEFVIFVPENSGLSNLESISEQILDAIKSPIPGLKTNFALSGHIGISSFPEHGLTVQDLAKKADIAVSHAKTTGSSRIQKYGDGTGDSTAGEIRRDVHFAINNDELELYYQPKVNTLTNRVKSVEALTRWFHPKKGLISPADFIPAIENSDTTSELGEWVMRRACQDMKRWEDAGHVLNIAINIAARQFGSDDFVERIHKIVVAEECDPTRFEIEVTEETALSSSETANSVISQLHTLGFKVSLDDYGRGYSNLTRLSELQVNTIKIDGPLTARLTRDERTRVIFEATINMAKGLHCETVAEGVETAEEVAILSKLGCTELQGFYFATPMPQEGITNWIAKRQRRPVDDLQEQIRIAV